MSEATRDTYTLTLRCLNCRGQHSTFDVEIPKGMLWQDYHPYTGRKAGFGPPETLNGCHPAMGAEQFTQVLCPHCGAPNVTAIEGAVKKPELVASTSSGLLGQLIKLVDPDGAQVELETGNIITANIVNYYGDNKAKRLTTLTGYLIHAQAVLYPSSRQVFLLLQLNYENHVIISEPVITRPTVAKDAAVQEKEAPNAD